MPRRELSLEEFAAVFEKLEAPAGRSAAIGISDPQVAAYARVLEYGSIAGARPWPRPGPRTTYAVDPDTGARVIVSAQAPRGFIRVQAAGIASRLRDALTQAADWLDAEAVKEHLAAAVAAAARTALEAIRAAAPAGSGRLRDALSLLGE